MFNLSKSDVMSDEEYIDKIKLKINADLVQFKKIAEDIINLLNDQEVQRHIVVRCKNEWGKIMSLEDVLGIFDMVPLWFWQIVGSFALTMFSIQIIKFLQPKYWPPFKRRKINLALSILIGGIWIIYLYDQSYKEFVIIAFMLGNNIVYSALANFVSYQAQTKASYWLILEGVFRPYKKKVRKND